MKKIIRYFRLHIRTAYKNSIRHLGLTFSASIAISITLVLISIFMLLTSNLSNFTTHIEKQVTIRASIDNIVKEDEKKVLQETIQKLDNVSEVVLSTGDDELAAYKDEYSTNEALFSMYEGDTNPIRDTFIIEVKEGNSIEKVANQVGELKGIVRSDYGGSSTSALIKGFEGIRDGGFVFIVFLVFIAVFLISNKIKMSIYTRKNEIAIMRFVGASNWSVKLPLMLEGTFIGFLGSIIPVLLTVFGYQYVYQLMDGVIFSQMFQMKDVFPLTMYISFILLAIGMTVGFFGSFFSTTRYLRWKR